MLAMPTLVERLTEVMAAKGWEHADLVRISGQSSSVVSQWLGNAKRPIERIARVTAAVRLAEASGYSAEWIAEGVGPKRRRVDAAVLGGTHVAEPTPWGIAELLDELGHALARVPPSERDAVATNLAGWARDGGATHWKTALLALLASAWAIRKRAA